MPPLTATFYWDFFGPRAQPTAEHFVRHLNQFLAHADLSLTDCPTGTAAAPGGGVAAWCRAPRSAHDLIITRLRPRRVEGGGVDEA